MATMMPGTGDTAGPGDNYSYGSSSSATTLPQGDAGGLLQTQRPPSEQDLARARNGASSSIDAISKQSMGMVDFIAKNVIALGSISPDVQAEAQAILQSLQQLKVKLTLILAQEAETAQGQPTQSYAPASSGGTTPDPSRSLPANGPLGGGFSPENSQMFI